LTLSHAQNIFAFEFSALSFASPTRTRYRYRLEGLETHWNEAAATHRVVTYTTLPAGEYRFRVQSKDNRGGWSEPGLSLAIRVLPAWWNAWHFRTVLGASFALFLWLGHELRVRQLARQFNMRLDERVGERTRIARDLHDTLLQSFHGILLHLQAVSNELPGGKTKERLDSVIHQAEQAILEGRDAVQGLRRSTVECTELGLPIKTLAEELAASDSRRPDCTVHVEGTPRNLHPIIRDEVYRIGSEAMRNAFRHAQARRVEVEIRYDDRQFRLRVRDDGRGIDPAVLAAEGSVGHYGLRGMTERANVIGGALAVWSQPNEGTEVELRVPARAAYATAQRRAWFSRKSAERRGHEGGGPS
jgi:signal transduction histidine kinase